MKLGYHWYGLLFGKAKISLALLASTVTVHSHVAVWLGASSHDARTWVQAGVARVAGSKEPEVYVEVKTPTFYKLRTWAGAAGTAKLQHRGSSWRVLINGHESRWISIPRANRIACMEIRGDAHGTVRLGRRVLSR